MRRLCVLVVLIALLPLATASADSRHRNRARRVKVVNEPLAVEIVNPVGVQAVEVVNPVDVQAVEIVNPVAPTPAPPMRFQLVGFTTATYTGGMGGHFGVTQKCQLEFPDSRMCTLEEVAATTAIPVGLSGDAWAHQESGVGGVIFSADLERNQGTCGGWTLSIDGRLGQQVSSNGVAKTSGSLNCGQSNPVACCALVGP
jgi:hypothetical protein